MKTTASAVILGLVLVAPSAFAQTPAQNPQAGTLPAPTDIYHLHLSKAAPGEAAALGKALSQPDSSAPMPEHFIVLRHQEGDDWDYAVIRHLGQKAAVSIPPAPAAGGPALSAWHTDTFAAGPSWADFSKQMGLGQAAKPGGVYVVGFQRAVPGHRSQLEQALNQPPPADSKVETGNAFLWHVEGGDWQFLTITRYNSWQDFATERAAATTGSGTGWADIRQHSAFHRDTIADRIHPMK